MTQIKRHFQRTHSKEKIEWWFWGVLFLIVLMVYFITKTLMGWAHDTLNYYSYRVKPLDEQAIYQKLIQNESPAEASYLLNSVHSKISGLPYDQLNTHHQTMAVVIENYSHIRSQQAGLNEAKIVYEALAEGGITRFLALFDEKVDKIGPVRSARPYFIDWASEYRAAFVHVGGSFEALNNLASTLNVFNIDEIPGEMIIWRDPSYRAPHDAFTSIKNISQKLGEAKYFHPLKKERFLFKEESRKTGDVHHIIIPFSTKPYEVKYEFDEEKKQYRRFNGGVRHLDIQPDNVIIQFTEVTLADDKGRLNIKTDGSGEALIFRDGKVIEGTWKKEVPADDGKMSDGFYFTRFFDLNGNRISFNKGKTWIEVVPDNKKVNYF